MPTKRFTERTVAPIEGRVDREAGIIHGVKLLGRQSQNNREYTSDALSEALGLYEGVKVYVDHPRDFDEERKFSEWAGVVRNACLRPDGIYGDIQLRKYSGLFDAICEAAELFHEAFGMSHVADGESSMIDGREVVESITKVFSVDVVLTPATTSGMYESVRSSADIDARRFAEALRNSPPHNVDLIERWNRVRRPVPSHVGWGKSVAAEVPSDAAEFASRYR